jgi:hypothetical protein
LANADAEEAYFLANEVYSRGTARIEKAQREAVYVILKIKNSLKQADSDSELKNQLTRTANRHRYRIEHVANREKTAVQSVKRLTDTAEVTALVDEVAKNLLNHGEQAKVRFDAALEFAAKSKGVTITEGLTESAAESEARKVRPKRLFKGTLSFETLRFSLGEEAYSWYQKGFEKDLDLRRKIAEIVNYMNGQTSLHEILTKVSAEYTEITAETGLKILRDLEKVGLVVV